MVKRCLLAVRDFAADAMACVVTSHISRCCSPTTGLGLHLPCTLQKGLSLAISRYRHIVGDTVGIHQLRSTGAMMDDVSRLHGNAISTSSSL